MSLVQTQFATAGGVTSLVATFSQPVAIGDVVIVALDWNNFVNTETLTDSGANTYTTVVIETMNDPVGQLIAFAVNTSPTLASVTVTFDTMTNAEFRVHEFSGVATSNTFDSGGSSEGMQPTGGTVLIDGPILSPTSANELMIEYENEDSGTATNGPGWTLASGFNADVVEYMISTGPGPVQSTDELTTVNGGYYTAMGAVFRTQ